MMQLSDHDKTVEAMVKIFSAYGFDVRKYHIEGKRRDILKGNSGVTYFPNVLATRGTLSILCDVRTRGQRGIQEKIDKGAVQFHKAILDDLAKTLKNPQGMIVNPYGVQKNAKKLADHFGIIIRIIPWEFVDRIRKLDLDSEKSKIIEDARKLGIVF